MDKFLACQILERELKIMYKGLLIAQHRLTEGRRQRVLVREHLRGIVGAFKTVVLPKERESSELLRPLAEYEEAVGGGW